MKHRNVYASYTYFCCGFCCSIILWMQIQWLWEDQIFIISIIEYQLNGL